MKSESVVKKARLETCWNLFDESMFERIKEGFSSFHQANPFFEIKENDPLEAMKKRILSLSLEKSMNSSISGESWED